HVSHAFTGTAATTVFALPLHDALPSWIACWFGAGGDRKGAMPRRARKGRIGLSAACYRHVRITRLLRLRLPLPSREREPEPEQADRKSTRLNSSHVKISYAVVCLKNKI